MAAKNDPMVHVRLPKELMRDVDHFAIDIDAFRSGAMERLLRIGLRQTRENGKEVSGAPA